MVELSRASPVDLRAALLRAKFWGPANTSGHEDFLGRGGDAPSDGAALLLITTQFPEAGTPAECVAMESADRIRLSRAPYTKYDFLLPRGAHPPSAERTDSTLAGRALAYLRRVAERAVGALARAVAAEREVARESVRVLYAPHAASGKGLAPLCIRPGRSTYALGVLRTPSRIVRDAAHVETEAYGYSMRLIVI